MYNIGVVSNITGQYVHLLKCWCTFFNVIYSYCMVLKMSNLYFSEASESSCLKNVIFLGIISYFLPLQKTFKASSFYK